MFFAICYATHKFTKFYSETGSFIPTPNCHPEVNIVRTPPADEQWHEAGPAVCQIDVADCVFKRNATYCISPYSIVMCVCVCLFVCVCRDCRPQENGLRYRRRFCFEMREIKPDIICKSLTQIGFQIPRWRTK